MKRNFGLGLDSMCRRNFAFILLISWQCAHIHSYGQTVSEVLRSRLQRTPVSGNITANEPFYRPDLVNAFYQTMEFEPAWVNELNVAVWLGVLQCAGDEGLEPNDYHLQTLHRLYSQKERSVQEQASFELLLTDAFMHYGSHLLTGKINPTILYPGNWETTNRKADLVLLLQEALLENCMAGTVAGLRPQHEGYRRLREALLHFRNLEVRSDWIEIPSGISIKPGMNDERILQVRNRLKLTGPYDPNDFADSTWYDSALLSVIEGFQQQHGLLVDGIIGKRTLAALNATPRDYIRKIQINMERHRWLPVLPEEDYVTINIPSFQLDLMRGDSLVMSMRAIIGRKDRMTPVFISDIHYLILNPTWTVPPTILREDVLPAVKRNISYLRRNNLRVIDGNGAEVSPEALPWASYSASNFPYQLRQDPGPSNSLGLIKFQFPNNHRVFLHDTNVHGLFSNYYRALSSGCIRIEHPFQLAFYLLRNTEWNEDRIFEIIRSGKTHTIIFPRHVPIFINYFTGFVDEHNTFQLRDDLYGWDEILIRNFF